MDAVRVGSELATLRAKTLEQNRILNEQHQEIAKLRGLETVADEARKDRDRAIDTQRAAEQSAAAARRTAEDANRRALAAEARVHELEAAFGAYDQAVAQATRIRDLLGGGAGA
jgi:hypothetical protein